MKYWLRVEKKHDMANNDNDDYYQKILIMIIIIKDIDNEYDQDGNDDTYHSSFF